MKKTFLAPAKINLCLHVLGKRPDGYHDLCMVMQRVSLYDHLEISLTREKEVRVLCPGVDIPPGGENIAGRAARRMLEMAGADGGAVISIDKGIPVAAGLGGGSSDAAAVLMGLDEMLGLNLSRESLMEEGGRLGADVPFFIFEDPALATGIGDVLEKIDGLPDVWYVLVNPGVAVSTAWVYKNLRLTSPGDGFKLPGFPRTAKEVVPFLHNDLEAVTAGRFPVITEIREKLISLGALGSLMSGSGPTVFGVFEAEPAARQAAEVLRGETGWKVFVVNPLVSSG
jgi:4-diphosphocytidyl-2-C-methyl-D-erythritol kinase